MILLLIKLNHIKTFFTHSQLLKMILEKNKIQACYDKIRPKQPRRLKEWNKHVTMDMRSYLIEKILDSLISIDNMMVKDFGMDKLISFASRLEGEIYDEAQEQNEYFHLVALKTFEFTKELINERTLS
jgi:hypothetical protein